MYANALKTRPLRTNVATSGLITVASDTIAQYVDRQSAERKGSACDDVFLDMQRSLSMLCWGTVVSGCALFYWFRFLDRLFPPERNTIMRVLAKVGVNQAGLAFPLNGAFFGVATARAHDLTKPCDRRAWLADWERKVRDDLPITVVQSTSFWGPVQALNFVLVPQYARALYVNVAFFTWTTYLSYIGFRPATTKAS